MKWLSNEAVGRLRAAAQAPDLSGTRYRLIGPMGRGGMGAVYLAEDTELQRPVALKVLHLADLSGDAAARLRREARILARLEHPGIVPVHDASTLPDGRVFYAMKRIEGTRLDQYRGRSPLRLFEKICETVAFAHSRGVVHRDLKPENIMVGPFGEVLVMDWGVATSAAEPEAGVVAGTRGYMAPEQARGEEVDERSDIYALGVILDYLAPKPAPRPLAAICRKAMAALPAARYATVIELAADVARYLDGAPVSAYRENLLERAARLASRHRAAILLVAAYLVVRAVLFLFTRR